MVSTYVCSNVRYVLITVGEETSLGGGGNLRRRGGFSIRTLLFNLILQCAYRLDAYRDDQKPIVASGPGRKREEELAIEFVGVWNLKGCLEGGRAVHIPF